MKNILLLLALLVFLATGLPACGNAAQEPLPRSFKGYELYSWQQGGKWHFTLITGTNRNKNIEEIVSAADELTQDGWVNIHVTGVEKIKETLGSVPSGEFVSWIGGHFFANSDGDVSLELPPAEIVDDVKEYAERHGLEISVF